VAGCSSAVGFILSHIKFVFFFFFTDETHFTGDGANNTSSSHLWDRDNPQGTVESNYQHRFSVSVWYGAICDQLIGPYVFPQHPTGDIYNNFLQDELPALLENVRLQKRRQVYYHKDGTPPAFNQVVRQYLNHKFPNTALK
jgi:hypothetical protein